MTTKIGLDAGNRKEFLTRGTQESWRLMTCNEAREIARLTRGEKFIDECGNFEVDSMVNWQPVERTEFNGNRLARGPGETTRANVFWTR